MKASVQWLKKWVAFQDIESTAEMLSLRGLEVESIDPVAGEFTDVYVGKVIECGQHPDADKLSLCQIDIGSGDLLQIVCGARNVRTGLKVAVAIVGATLPGIKIKKAKLRGVESYGMLCSEVELGLAEQSDGILELPADALIGTSFKELYSLNDQVLDISITPNRGDCASIIGISREIAAIHDAAIVPNESTQPPVVLAHHDKIDIQLKNAKGCPKYLGRVIKNINPSAVSPVWLTETLRRAGLRSIHPVVDVTNFVMLELGQPMHAFDLNKFDGDIVVRNATAGEKIKLLDETDLCLDENSLVIADKQKVLALAGVMGGLDSAVSSETKDVLLESAYFSPKTIAFSARKYQIQSDSSYRFERAVDSTQQLRAIERATQLIQEIVGGDAGVISEACEQDYLPRQPKIKLRFSRVNQLLGTKLLPERIIDILLSLSMSIEWASGDRQGADYCVVIPPSYRHDIQIEADLIEEVLRVIGCDAIEEQAPSAEMLLPPETISKAISMEAPRQMLQQQGYSEIISYSFVDPKLSEQFSPATRPILLANPISQEMSVMRLSLWPGLLATAMRNLNRQQNRVKLFEYGLCFLSSDSQGEIQQNSKLAGLSYGNVLPEQWGEAAREIDFFDVKSEVEALLSQIVPRQNVKFVSGHHPALHPGRSACVHCCADDGFINAGWIGELHPSLVQKHRLNSAPILFELDYSLLVSHAKKNIVFKPLSKFPELRRDLAFIVDKHVPAEDLLCAIRLSGEENVFSAELFDFYEGASVPEGKKSLAISVILQDFSKTLVDEDVAKVMKRVVTLIESKFGATLRD